MRNFVMTFWHTLTTPEEWHTASIIVVGVAMALTLGVLFGEAFDVQVLGMYPHEGSGAYSPTTSKNFMQRAR